MLGWAAGVDEGATDDDEPGRSSAAAEPFKYASWWAPRLFKSCGSARLGDPREPEAGARLLYDDAQAAFGGGTMVSGCPVMPAGVEGAPKCGDSSPPPPMARVVGVGIGVGIGVGAGVGACRCQRWVCLAAPLS